MATNPISAQTAATPSVQDNALAKLSGDYTMFLKLLTSQMQNQDPLDPMDTSQYTQQLVQYSQVEQSIQQSGTLKEILARLSGQDMIQASALIGREASYDGATAGLSADAPARWQWQGDRTPASLVATIRDAAGRVVDTRQLSADVSTLQWDGQLATGAQAQPGAYTLSLDARDASGNAIPLAIEGVGMVESVSQRGAALSLTIGGVAVAADALRDVALAPRG